MVATPKVKPGGTLSKTSVTNIIIKWFKMRLTGCRESTGNSCGSHRWEFRVPLGQNICWRLWSPQIYRLRVSNNSLAMSCQFKKLRTNCSVYKSQTQEGIQTRWYPNSCCKRCESGSLERWKVETTNMLKPVGPAFWRASGVANGDAATAPRQVRRVVIVAMDLNMPYVTGYALRNNILSPVFIVKHDAW